MNNIEDYIVKVPNVIPEEVCNQLINEFANSDEWKLGTMGKDVNTYLRNCQIIPISERQVITKNPEVRVKLDQEIFNSVAKAVSVYIDKFPKCVVQNDSGYHLLRYNVGEYIKSHVDTSSDKPRELSCSLGLNNEYTGGEFYFANLNKTIRLEKGEVLLFPSNFVYPHEILPVTAGTRYSIITWLS